jgi:putative membrane protein
MPPRWAILWKKSRLRLDTSMGGVGFARLSETEVNKTMMGYGGAWVMALVLLVLFLVLLAVVIVGGIWLISRSSNSGKASVRSEGEDSLEILRQRYARGEITREQYQTMREDLAK